MVLSPEQKKSASLHDLTDFAVAKQVVEDFPKIMNIYNALLPALAHYEHYLVASNVIGAVKDSQTLMNMQMEQFQKILDAKGKVDGE